MFYLRPARWSISCWRVILALFAGLCTGCSTLGELGQDSIGSDRPSLVHIVGSSTGLSIGSVGGPHFTLGRQHFVATYLRSVAGPAATTDVQLGDVEHATSGAASGESAPGIENDVTLSLTITPESAPR